MNPSVIHRGAPPRPLLVAAFLALAAPAAAQRPCGPPVSLGPAPDLYCMRLTAAPGVPGSAVVELGRDAGPFTVAVTVDGHLRYRPVVRLEGLPAASELGDFQGYVAWIAAPTMFPERRLGVVRPGADARLPEIDLDKFVVLVTAEPDTTKTERSGRILFRGGSPSTRMQPADVMEFAMGARFPGAPHAGTGPGGAAAPSADTTGPAAADSARHGMHAGHDAPPGDTATWRWIHPPMPEGVGMLPAMMDLRPEVDAFLPGHPDEGPAVLARPNEIIRLEDGDTLRLEAGVVDRLIDGHTVRMYAFNGQYPGPVIWVPRDARIVVDFTNRIDQPTTVHWHGLRLENRFDGAAGLTQAPVEPGETFRYELIFPDPGLYWYHPHMREDVQQGLGLYGNMMVRDPRGDYYAPAHREELIVLDDLLMTDQGLVPFGRERPTHGFMGRFGNVFLVNGVPDWSMSARQGEVVRFFVTNVANTRTFNLSIRGPGDAGPPEGRGAPGDAGPPEGPVGHGDAGPPTGAVVPPPVDPTLELVGSDIGNFEREERVGSVVIAPAERYIVQTRFDRPGTYALVNRVRGIDHLFGSFFAEEDTLGIVTVAHDPAPQGPGDAFDGERAHPWVIADMDRYRSDFDRPVDRELELVLETGELPWVVERMMQFDSAYFHPVEWSGTMPMMNWASTSMEARWKLREPSTGRENMDIRWDFEVGDVVKVRIHNVRESLHAMQHPIHFHGQRFLVLDVNGVRNENLVWKDTTLVPVGATVDILLELTNPGDWMAHCHIAEHLESGMMLAFGVAAGG